MAGFFLTIFVGAFLLFQVQPMIGKVLLPGFGGTPAVWTTCLLFFQIVLLLGYAYAHYLIDRFDIRVQARVHLGVLLISSALLVWQWVAWEAPSIPPTGFMTSWASWKLIPVVHVVALLTMAVGLPYFALASTSPLMQAWFSRTHPGKSPYRLYALSNAGSLLGLFSYPFLVEPFFNQTTQGWLWSAVYLVGFVGGSAVCAARLGPVPARVATASREAPPGDRHQGNGVYWVLLPACATALLLATTNQLCQEVAVVPFLWALPLGLYLLSFIICFDREHWYQRRFFVPALVLASLGVAILLNLSYEVSVWLQIGSFSGLLFLGCMVLHGELARLKPAASKLTGFYLAVAAGGALGGVLVGLGAPALLEGYWEFHLALWAVCLVATVVIHRFRTGKGRWISGTFASAWLVGLAVILASHWMDYLTGARHLSRNFFGVLRVVAVQQNEPSRSRFRLMHGGIAHGYQFVSPDLRDRPTCYYGPDSGVGRAIHGHPSYGLDQGIRIGVIGLGVGTVATYGRPGDVIRFYEINPEVVRLARGMDGHFSYLSRNPARMEIVEGDARVSLDREWNEGGSQGFDLLVVDAFNSDSVPVHLLTLEAFRIYLSHLKGPHGLIAIHITNKSLDLRPVLRSAAAELDLSAVEIEDRGDGLVTRYSQWMVLASNPDSLAHPRLALDLREQGPENQLSRPWTDRFSNLFEIVRW